MLVERSLLCGFYVVSMPNFNALDNYRRALESIALQTIGAFLTGAILISARRCHVVEYLVEPFGRFCHYPIDGWVAVDEN